MLHIILLLLKIIGIAVLVLLGIALALILLVLFVPVRYQVDGAYDGKPRGTAKITWLLHILSVTAAYEEQLDVKIRVFGINLTRFFMTGQEAEEETEDLLVHAMEAGEEMTDAGTEVGEEAESESLGKESLKSEPLESESPDKDSLEKDSPKRESAESESLDDESLKGNSLKDDSLEDDSLKDDSPKDSSLNSDFSNNDSPNSDSAQPGPQKPGGRFLRFRRLPSLILSKIKFLFRRICDTLKDINGKKAQVEALVRDPANQKTAKLLWRQLKKIIRHILPRKGKAQVTFGFDDPYTTGQALTYASVIYPMCHKHLDLYPVFDESVLKGEGFLKGRIRLGTLLGAGIRILLDKNFRTILWKWLR